MDGHRLADHLPVLPLGLGLLPDHMLLLMTTDSGGRLLRGHICSGLKRHPRVIGAVLILAVLAGLALGLLHNLLGRLVLLLGQLQAILAPVQQSLQALRLVPAQELPLHILRLAVQILDPGPHRHLSGVSPLPHGGELVLLGGLNGPPVNRRDLAHRLYGNRLSPGHRAHRLSAGGLCISGIPVLIDGIVTADAAVASNRSNGRHCGHPFLHNLTE